MKAHKSFTCMDGRGGSGGATKAGAALLRGELAVVIIVELPVGGGTGEFIAASPSRSVVRNQSDKESKIRPGSPRRPPVRMTSRTRSRKSWAISGP